MALEREEFAARRRTAQDEYVEALRPAVQEAVRSEDWARLVVAAEVLFRQAYTEETGEEAPPMPEGWAQRIEDTLEKTKGDTAATVERISLWLASLVINVASAQAALDDEEDVFLEWVTMHDDDVRAAHRRTDGQQRPVGEMFDVDGTPMEFPGDSRAPIELWINCRCTLRPTLPEEALVASSDSEPMTSTVVVALPTEGLAVHDIGDEQKHVTLLFAGEASEEVVARLNEVAMALAETYEPFTAEVAGTATLGSDEAKVLLVEAHEFNALHGALEQDETIAAALRGIDTHPHFIPHMTLTYGEINGPVDLQGEALTFDRLAVWSGDTQIEYPLGGGTVDEETETDEALTAAADPDVRVPWHGVLAPEGIRSGDGRKFAEGSLRHRDLPLPLTWQKVSDDGHKGNVTVASIEQVEMVDGEMRASGWFIDNAEAAEVMSLIAEFGRFGVSVDADDATFEVDEEAEEVVFTDARVCSACIVPIPAFMQAWVALGTWPSSDSEPQGQYDESLAASALASESTAEFVDVSPGRTEDGPGWLTHPVDTDRLRDYWTHGAGAAKIGWGTPGDFNRCRAAVAEYVKPQYLAGYCANRHYDALGFWPGRPVAGKTLKFESVAENLNLLDTEQSEAITLTAAGMGHCAPSEWFENPEFSVGDGRMSQDPSDGTWGCPNTITPEGRVFGHIAKWGTCHIGFSGQCVTPPHSVTDYAHFKTGAVLLDNGQEIAVGNLTIGGGHAAPNLGMRAALAHYDSTSATVADVNVGEDEFGIWFAGWIRPGASDDMVTAFRASALSGDWRKTGGNLEMIAALAVNVPGFGIPRTRVAASAKGQVSLVAAGVVPPVTSKSEVTVDVDALAAAIMERIAERQRNKERMAALAARLNGAQ